MMDNAIDVSRFPLEAQRQEAIAKRRIGLGVTGLADALIFCQRALRLAGKPRADRALACDPEPRRLSRLGRTGARKKARSRCSTREAYLVAAAYPGAAATDIRDAHRRAWHPQRAAHLHRAHRHDFAVRRQCLQRHRAGVRL